LPRYDFYDNKFIGICKKLVSSGQENYIGDIISILFYNTMLKPALLKKTEYFDFE